MNYQIIDIKTASHEKQEWGSLSYVESGLDIPFEIKRVYYIYGVEAALSRGAHAHRELQQILICPYGSIKIKMDDGTKNEEIILDTPSMGLVIAPEVWHEMEWLQENSVLLVAASGHYDSNDYIRDYQTFLEFAEEKRSASLY